MPADADYVVYLDVQGALADETLRNLTNTYLELQAGGKHSSTPASVEGVLGEVRNSTELAPEGLLSATMFGTTPDSETAGLAGQTDSAGVVVQATWSEEALVGAIENSSAYDLEASSYAGATLYSPTDATAASDSYLGVLGDDRYVVGTEERVKAVLDVSAGDADALSGDLRSAFADTREDGYVRYAMTVPQDQVPTDRLENTSGVSNPEIFTEVETVSGAQYTDGDTVGLSMTMHVGSTDAAKDLADVLAGVFAFARQSYGETPAAGLMDRDSLSATQSGSTVTVTSENGVAELNTILELVVGIGTA